MSSNLDQREGGVTALIVVTTVLAFWSSHEVPRSMPSQPFLESDAAADAGGITASELKV